VIGGGIIGVAVARECAGAGRRTLLVEQNDFASGTTSRATRIIHGGLRYLEHGQIGLVRESLRERQRLLRSHPHLVKPLQFILALDRNGYRNALAVRAGLWLYKALAPAITNNSNGNIRKLEAALDAGRHWALFPYDDAQCEFPERLVIEWLGQATAAGAVVRNYTQALQIETSHGRVRSLRLRDRLTPQESRINANWIINASGPWADRVISESPVSVGSMLGGVRGSHIVLPRFAGAPESAVYTEAPDGRPVFVIPWNGQLLVGTTEVPDQADPGRTQPTAAEIHYLLGVLKSLFPSAPVGLADIRYAFAGVRPLPFSPNEKPAAVTRRHFIHDHSDQGAAGLLSIIGGKLTTAASVARECARRIGLARELDDSVIALGCDHNGQFTTWVRQLASTAQLSEATALGIAEWFGPKAMQVAEFLRAAEMLRKPLCSHTTHVVGEAVYAIHHEYATKLSDMLLRRVPVALDGTWSEECGREAARRIGAALGWNDRTIQHHIEEFEAERAAFLVKPDTLRNDDLRVSILGESGAK
jgi:glycerol-3-phosphate dehydrogenase